MVALLGVRLSGHEVIDVKYEFQWDEMGFFRLLFEKYTHFNSHSYAHIHTYTLTHTITSTHTVTPTLTHFHTVTLTLTLTVTLINIHTHPAVTLVASSGSRNPNLLRFPY